MGSTQPLLRRAIAVAVAFIVIAATPMLAAPALADPTAPTPVSSGALPTVQVDGVVWSQVVIGHTAFAGGKFTAAQPPGASASDPSTPRANLLAYDVDSGQLITSFAPKFNGQVRGLAASPDGSRLYVVGNFTGISGTARQYIAALNPSTGAVLSDFAPSLNSYANGITSTSSRVYVGGAFTAASGSERTGAAAFSSSGAVLPWAPRTTGGVVRAVAVAPDGSKVLVAGGFTSTNGQTSPGRGMAAVDTASGASLPWATGKLIHNGGVVNDPAAPTTASSSIYSLSTRGDVVYATGQATGTTWQDANLEGMVAMRWSDGGLKWIEDCHGDTYSSVAFDDAVYVAGHAHNCSTLGGFGEKSPGAQRAIGFSQAATQTLRHNEVQGPGSYQDFFGQPAPSLLEWYPTLTTGTFTGQYQAAWSVTQGAGYLLYGGEFQSVNGKRQTGLVRFRGYPDPVTGAIEDPTPTTSPTPTTGTSPTPTDGTTEGSRPNRVSAPDAVALGPTKVAVKWRAPKAAAADKVSGYIVKAYKGAKLVKTVSVGKAKRLAVVSGLGRSTLYRIGITATNSHGTGKQSVLDPAKTKAKGTNVSATKKPTKVAKPTVGAGKARVRVQWKRASATGALGISKYQVRVALHGRAVKTATVDDRLRAKLVSGLKRDAVYTVSVRAGSWAGWGAWSTPRGARTK